MTHRRWWWVAGVVLVAAGVAACGSDKFGVLGSRLPIDVHQDSLAVADTLVGAAEEHLVIPVETQALSAREVLYLGSDAPSGVRATPLMRFDFSSVPDSIDIFQYEWHNVRIDLEWLKRPKRRPHRALAIYELADTLNASTADQPLPAVLGDSLAFLPDILGTGQPGQDARDVPLSRTVVESWLRAGGHKGIALVDRTTLPDTNLVGFASGDLVNTSVVDSIGAFETITPELIVEVQTNPVTFLQFPVLLDVTHFQRPSPGADLEVSTHLPARTWLRFDLSGVDRTATINSAMLVLPVDTLRTIGSGLIIAAAYRCTIDEAIATSVGSLEEVLDSPRQIDMGKVKQLELNVTEFVQRKVNGVLRDGDGLLVALDSELLELRILQLYNSAAVDPALRPRIELRVTPPAEYDE